MLETEFAPFGFAAVFALAALTAGIWLALRWRAAPAVAQGANRRPTRRIVQEELARLWSRASVQTVLLAAFAGVGGGWIGNYAGYALGIRLSDLLALSGIDGKEFIVLSIVATIAVLVGAAVWLVLRHYGSDPSLKRLAARGAITLAAIALITPQALGLSRRLDSAHDAIRQAPTIYFEVRLPADAAAPHSRDGISVALATENGTIPSKLYQNDWIDRDGDRTLIKGFIDDAEPARQRIMVFSLPGEPKRLFDLRLPRIPKSARHNGAWQRVDFIEAQGERRPADTGEDFHIRFHAWRPS